MLFDPSIDGPDQSLRRDGVEQTDTRNDGGNLVPLEVTDEVPSFAILSRAGLVGKLLGAVFAEWTDILGTKAGCIRGGEVLGHHHDRRRCLTFGASATNLGSDPCVVCMEPL